MYSNVYTQFITYYISDIKKPPIAVFYANSEAYMKLIDQLL